MLKIAITPPVIHPSESSMISAILDGGWDFVHLRHPDASLRDMRNLIEQIPQRHYTRLKLHGHFDLLSDFNLGGIHLNRRCPAPPPFFNGKLSRSCHSTLEVLSCASQYSYVTLSPIFPRISKPGYTAEFTHEELAGLPEGKVIALGGITPDNITRLQRYPFAGFAVLGYLWASPDEATLLCRLKEFDIKKQV